MLARGRNSDSVLYCAACGASFGRLHLTALYKKLVFKGKIMSIQHVSFQECNNQFSKIFERVLKNHEVISVSKESEQAIVILDAKEYSSLIETLYLLSNPINANRLREGISQHQQGLVREIDVKAYLD
jgi:antitoxin YefM